ncbi:6973_t:CDS:1 [Ambispora gerdemannii]|uniref:6973_t:CDS:1 n=1 Tax=Ambispora gerdemannii TaxID=144530 RepID=A0A9N8V4M9_9GLOM|nr:6973_t:CDS:1 [Ambispora gerdemannii]
MNHWEKTVKELINALLEEYQPTLATLPTTYLSLDKLLEPPSREAKTISNDFLLYRKDCNARVKSTQRLVHQVDLSTIVQNSWKTETHEVKGLYKMLAGILLQATQNARAQFDREEVLKRSKKKRKSMKPWETSTRIPSMFVKPVPNDEHDLSGMQHKGDNSNNNRNNESTLIITKQMKPFPIEIPQDGNISTTPTFVNYFLDSNLDAAQNTIPTDHQAQGETIEHSTLIGDTDTLIPQLGVEYNTENNEHFNMQTSFLDFYNLQINSYPQDIIDWNNDNFLYDTTTNSENIYVFPSGSLSNIMYLNNDTAVYNNDNIDINLNQQ